MKKIYRLLLTVAGITFLSLNLVFAGGLNEDAALKILLRTLEQDHVYAKRISLDCVTFETEETTRIYFEFALREKHAGKCAGDPDTSPVIDRYRVNRASGKIEWFNAVDDNWQPYNAPKIR
jgi:hypothetical protein